MTVPTWDVDVRRRLQHGDRRFDLAVQWRSAAQRLVLFGPSGAGKTQTLQMIAGLARPDRGHIRLGGTALFDAAGGVDLRPQARRLAYVFQDYALFPHLTVRQNVAFGVRRGWLNPGRQVRHAAVDRWLDAFSLASLAGLYPDQLSGGQRQRTALARALVAEPRALLLDEPFAALDRGLRRRLRGELSRLLGELQLPMILITHDEEDVEDLADEVVHLDAGRVVAHPVVG